MDEEVFRKFDKETWLRFYKYMNKLDQSLFDCLSALQRNVEIEKLTEKYQEVSVQIKAVEFDENKVLEYCRLLKKSIRIHKQLDKLYESIM